MNSAKNHSSQRPKGRKKSLTCLLAGVVLLLAILAGLLGTHNAAKISGTDTTASVTSAASLVPTTAGATLVKTTTTASAAGSSASSFQFRSVAAYSGSPYAVVNNNVPYFTKSELSNTHSSYEFYSSLDSYGRCGVCMANVGKDLMPTEKRGAIGSVKPTGWHLVKYDNVDGKYLYNRCHLIGYQLTAENANVCNLITGTRYLNIEGMLPFENMTADYIKETGNHVLYRVTPIFSGNDLLARGVLMEARSVEDNGSGVEFCVFCYNVQPGIAIDYATGASSSAAGSSASGGSAGTRAQTQTTAQANVSGTYILNTNTKKFHRPDCRAVRQMSSKNKQSYSGSRSELLREGYEPCQICNP